ncbi:P-loop containing nucleoside triphosphate hydrolase [Pseudocohnilembus persalinus]|uniref:p-loop containing nucleoside triphosphate hydrolase n=1 Tax=Pseudocohnilembus persalinus TaxID=266149 RepID=A0A0V0Q9R5_PSEPJ|nr:P-loop containing nucleoside triphosphate hydrolase [Pseudocohnilembus persalinus]|eukprot:KRW98807.1 P-loop containing nucleoside triphosphate hydrolase [Pseudocohnilembus persalinus]
MEIKDQLYEFNAQLEIYNQKSQQLVENSQILEQALQEDQQKLQTYLDQKNALQNLNDQKMKGQIFFIGPQSFGKTQIFNSLIEQPIYPSKSGECTQRPQSEPYRLYSAKLQECCGIQIPQKQMQNPITEGVENIYNYLDNINKNYPKTLEEFQEKLNFKYKQLNEFQKLSVYIYEGPIPKLDPYGTFIKDTFYIVDVPGLDTTDKNKEQLIINAFGPQQCDFYETNIPLLLGEVSDLTKKSFIDIIDQISKKKQDIQNKIQQQDEIYQNMIKLQKKIENQDTNNSIQTEEKENYQTDQDETQHELDDQYEEEEQKLKETETETETEKKPDDDQNLEQQFKNFFLVINKFDTSTEKELDEILNSITVTSNSNYQQILKNQSFKVSALNSLQKCILTGNFNDYDQIQQQKQYQLKWLLQIKQGKELIYNIFDRFDKENIFEENENNDFNQITQDFYQVIYSEKGQKHVQKIFSRNQNGVQQFANDIIRQSIQIFLQNFKLQIDKLQTFQQIFCDDEIVKSYNKQNLTQQKKVQEIFFKWHELLQNENSFINKLQDNFKNYKQYLTNKIEEFQSEVKNNKIKDQNDSKYQEIKGKFDNQIAKIIQEEYKNSYEEIILDYFLQNNEHLKQNKDCIPLSIVKILEARFQIQTIKSLEKLQIQNPNQLLNKVGLAGFFIVNGISALSIFSIDAIICAGVMPLILNQVALIFGIGAVIFGSLFSYDIINKKAIQKFSENLDQECKKMKESLFNKLETLLELQIEIIREDIERNRQFTQKIIELPQNAQI